MIKVIEFSNSGVPGPCLCGALRGNIRNSGHHRWYCLECKRIYRQTYAGAMMTPDNDIDPSRLVLVETQESKGVRLPCRNHDF